MVTRIGGAWAHSAFCSKMSGEYVRSLFVTLRRGMAGKPDQHRRIVEALGLRVTHHCVEKPNNESIRGMLGKISHLVIVETDRMFYLREMKRHYEQLNRDPWIVQHKPLHVTQAQQHHQQQQQEQQQRARPPPSRPPEFQQNSQQPRPRWIPPVTPMSLRIAQQATAPTLAVQPLQSALLEPHLQEHMTPLPHGQATQYAEPAIGPSLAEQIVPLLAKRRRLVERSGLYHPEVAVVNQQIVEMRRKQVEEEEAHRQAVLIAQHTPGPHKAKVHASGRGGRRGMLAEAREQAAKRKSNPWMTRA